MRNRRPCKVISKYIINHDIYDMCVFLHAHTVVPPWCAMSTDTNLVDVGMTFRRIQRKVNPNRFTHKHADAKNDSTFNFCHYISDHNSQPSTKHPPQKFSIPKAAKLAIQKTSANRMIVFIKWLQKKQQLQKIKIHHHHQENSPPTHPTKIPSGWWFQTYFFFSKKSRWLNRNFAKDAGNSNLIGSMWLAYIPINLYLENQPCHVGRWIYQNQSSLQDHGRGNGWDPVGSDRRIVDGARCYRVASGILFSNTSS